MAEFNCADDNCLCRSCVRARLEHREVMREQPAPSPSAGTPPAERDPYAFGRYALPPQAGTPPATVTPEAKSLSAAATGEGPASGSTIHAGTPPVRDETRDHRVDVAVAYMAGAHAGREFGRAEQAGPPPVGEPALDVRPWEVHVGHDVTGYPCYFIHGFAGDQKRDVALHERNARLIEQAPVMADEITRLRDALAQAQRERDEARHVVCETLWMAGRYADGRRSYAVGMYNDARRKAEAGGYAADAKPAVDGDSPDWPTLVERAEAAEATLAQARAEFWREAAQVAREWALGGDNPLDDVNVVLRQLADQMDQRATPTPAPPQE